MPDKPGRFLNMILKAKMIAALLKGSQIAVNLGIIADEEIDNKFTWELTGFPSEMELSVEEGIHMIDFHMVAWPQNESEEVQELEHRHYTVTCVISIEKTPCPESHKRN